jgi:Fe2+ or Zn2+ uptake regulation protein
MTSMRCPFCNEEKDDVALVCANCGRDTAIPESLISERAELLQKRDDLRAELARANARLVARRGRKSRAGPA